MTQCAKFLPGKNTEKCSTMSICDYKNSILWKDKDLGKFVDETVDDLNIFIKKNY